MTDDLTRAREFLAKLDTWPPDPADLASLLAAVRAEGRAEALREAADAMRDDGEDEGDGQFDIDRRAHRIRLLAEKGGAP